MEEEHAHKVVAALVHSSKMHQGIYARSERSVEPTTALANEFWRSLGNISLTFGGLDICKMPLLPGFGDELETQDTILSQEHVLLEDVHVLNSFPFVDLGCGVISMEILFERATHDRSETIGREGSRQDTDIPKGTFQRLVKDVTDLVFEVLGSNQRVE